MSLIRTARKTASDRPAGQTNHPLVDELLLSKVRLGVVAALLNREWVAFSELARSLDVSSGNLGAHLAKLVDAAYIDEEKAFVDRRPQTRYRLTPLGHHAFVDHVSQLQSLLKAARA